MADSEEGASSLVLLFDDEWSIKASRKFRIDMATLSQISNLVKKIYLQFLHEYWCERVIIKDAERELTDRTA
jgi:hypothetical protein